MCLLRPSLLASRVPRTVSKGARRAGAAGRISSTFAVKPRRIPFDQKLHSVKRFWRRREAQASSRHLRAEAAVSQPIEPLGVSPGSPREPT